MSTRSAPLVGRSPSADGAGQRAVAWALGLRIHAARIVRTAPWPCRNARTSGRRSRCRRRWCRGRCGCRPPARGRPPPAGARSSRRPACARNSSMSVAAPLHTASRLMGGESRPCRPGSCSDRPRVRCLDSSSTPPSTRVTTGLMESSEPSRARAPPMRPPFSRCSRVSTTPKTWVRGMSSLGPAAASSSSVGAGGGQLGHVEHHQALGPWSSSGSRWPGPGCGRPPPWPPRRRPGRWRTPRPTG